MNYLKNQCTIGNETSCVGIGLHTGVESKITFKPAPEEFGIRFKRMDVKGCPEIRADIDHVVDISRGTTIEENSVRIHTVEHALAACVGIGLDNVLIELTAKEPPVMDGSAIDFVEALLKAGIVQQNAPKNYLHIDEAVGYSDHSKGLQVSCIAAALGAAVIEKHCVTLPDIVFTHALPLERPAHVLDSHCISRRQSIYTLVTRDIHKHAAGNKGLHVLDTQSFNAPATAVVPE